jgi:hypothetical protein
MVLMHKNIDGIKDIQYKSLKRFFDDHYEYLDIIIPIITENSQVSLRDLDFTVTIFSKKNPIWYYIYNNETECKEKFVLSVSYDNELKGLKKKLFDTFRRSERIFYTIDHPERLDKTTREIIQEQNNNKCTFETTVSQLTFFKWAIQNKVIEYIQNNIDIIHQAHKGWNAKKNKSDKTCRKKLENINYKALKTIPVEENHKIIISFKKYDHSL